MLATRVRSMCMLGNGQEEVWQGGGGHGRRRFGRGGAQQEEVWQGEARQEGGRLTVPGRPHVQHAAVAHEHDLVQAAEYVPAGQGAARERPESSQVRGGEDAYTGKRSIQLAAGAACQ